MSVFGIQRGLLEGGRLITAAPAPGLYARVIKPLIDRTAALALLIVFAPVILSALALVRATSRGNPIYSQVRLGLGGRTFRIFKIRSMYEDSERESGARWCVPGDDRVTPVGWFLRRTHVDELPQLWNVLIGDLSLIGPRPERPEMADEIEVDIPNFSDRLAVKPGITGLAQVQQPPDQTFDCTRRKLALDLAYIEGMGVWMDLRIIPATMFHLLGVPGFWVARICMLPSIPEPRPAEMAA